MNNALTKTLTAGLMHGLKGKHLVGDYGNFTLCQIILDNSLGDEYEKFLWRNDQDNSIRKFNCIPSLFPMSALTKEIEFKGERFVPIEVLQSMNFGWVKIDDGELCCDVHNGMPLSDMSLFLDQLNMWHFNIFNLSPDEFIEVNETNNPYK